ncbi:CLUMA_CG016677, isoform A [Clunio marinus]|uniref:CLUMA_CG016677, isoform A n=1 Tax=Clunio marinus TaxID=568069 RepID=A0A1J1ISK7_9DIPT|nr:CLUMA_CG016677, isoform A [Clunio marinus]
MHFCVNDGNIIPFSSPFHVIAMAYSKFIGNFAKHLTTGSDRFHIDIIPPLTSIITINIIPKYLSDIVALKGLSTNKTWVSSNLRQWLYCIFLYLNAICVADT